MEISDRSFFRSFFVATLFHLLKMSSLKILNPKSDQLRQFHALSVNIGAAKGLQGVLKTNLGPKGTIKMLVSSSGDIKLTKDGSILLHEMVSPPPTSPPFPILFFFKGFSRAAISQQIQHPTATLIARAATAQDDITGDGTTTNVLLIGEALRQSERFLTENVHPRILVDGFDLARQRVLEVLDQVKIPLQMDPIDKEVLLSVAKTSLRTKVSRQLADKLADIVTEVNHSSSSLPLPRNLLLSSLSF